jgi:hypothetical protein
MTTRQLARLLRKRHRETRSWARVASEFGVARAVVERIANGKYDPANPELRARLGLGPRTCPTCQQRITVPKAVRTWRRLEDLRPAELLYILTNRTEME